MSWTQWMRSRVLNAVLVAFVTLPMGTPSVFAAYSQTDHLRPSATADNAARLLQEDADWDLSRRVEQLQTEARRRAAELPGLLSEAIADRRGSAGSPASVFDILSSARRPLTKVEIAREADDSSVRTIEPDLTALKRWNLIEVQGQGTSATYAVTKAAQAVSSQLLPVLRTVGASRDRAEWDGIAPQIAEILSGEARHARLRTVAAQMAPPTGGILAADESAGTAGRRLASKEVGLENTPENRQAMRRMLLTTPGLREAGISAIILDRDTLTNTTPDGQTLLVDHLHNQGIITGLKTDEGLDDDPASPAKTGVKRVKDPELTKLPALLQTATERGMGFTKYRTTVRANDPPEANMRLNAQAQARQAQRAQAAGLVPIVEPEVIFDGSDDSPATHELAASYAATTRMLELTFEELAQAGVWLDGMVLKTSMILAGKNAPQQTDAETVGFETLKGLVKTVPTGVAAVVFLSGGQGDDQATANLDAVIRASQTRFTEARDAAVAELRVEGNTTRAEAVAALTQAPWRISYSFGRGLQAKPLKAWGGRDDQVAQAQAVTITTSQEVQRARQGRLHAQPDRAPLTNGVQAAQGLLISPDEAASAVDVRDHRWIVVHSSLFKTQGAAAMQEWVAEQLQYVQGEDSNRALHFSLAVDGVHTQVEAEASKATLPETLAVTFEQAVPADEAGLASLTAAVPGSRIASVAGPRAFVETVKGQQEHVVGVVFKSAQPGAGESGASVIRTAVAAAASSEGRPNPVIAKQLDVAEADGLFIPTALPVLPETEAAMRAHQDKLRAIRATGGQA